MNELMKEKFDHAEGRMKKVIDRLQNEFTSIRAGRANPSVLDKIPVDYYGTPTPINQVAAVSVPEARMLMITPWDASMIRPISKAILASDLGINPTDDGKAIRLVFPQLTEERRKDLCKNIKKFGDEAKIAVRNERRDLADKYKAMKKNAEITEDDLKDSDKKVQTLTDKYVAKVDELVAEKEKEIMSI